VALQISSRAAVLQSILVPRRVIRHRRIPMQRRTRFLIKCSTTVSVVLMMPDCFTPRRKFPRARPASSALFWWSICPVDRHDERRRWHPDKFVARYGGALRPTEREELLEGVTRISQCLTKLLQRESSG